MSAADAQNPHERIHLAQDWQDPAVLSAALRIQPDDDVLSVCGAGDSAFALAIDDARSITCVDERVPQLALAELKLRSAEGMPVPGLQSVLGFDIGGNRVSLYHRVRERLSEGSRTFWGANEAIVREGIIRQGQLEGQLRAFRRRVLPLIHRRRTIDALLQRDEPADQRIYFDRHWNSRRWRGMVKLFFGAAGMSERLSESDDPHQGPVAGVLLARFERVACDLPARSNPFLHWFLTGRYPDMEATHPYLSTEGRAVLAKRGDRLRFVLDSVEGVLEDCEPGRFSAFHYGSLFDEVDAETRARILALTVRAARPGARICSWSQSGELWRPEALADRVNRDEVLTTQLRARDRSVLAGSVHVEVVRG